MLVGQDTVSLSRLFNQPKFGMAARLGDPVVSTLCMRYSRTDDKRYFNDVDNLVFRSTGWLLKNISSFWYALWVWVNWRKSVKVSFGHLQGKNLLNLHCVQLLIEWCDLFNLSLFYFVMKCKFDLISAHIKFDGLKIPSRQEQQSIIASQLHVLSDFLCV